MGTAPAPTPAGALRGCWRLPRLSNQVVLVFAVNLQQLITGYGIGFSSPCLKQLAAGGDLAPAELEWFASCLVLGQVLGSMLGPVMADKLGRRPTCLLASACSLGSWALLGTGRTGWLLLLARTLTGLTDCLSTSPGIIYISEVAETRLRGTYLNTCALASGLGIALGYLIGGAFSWRIASLFPPFLCCVAIPVLVIMKESPVFLLKKQREALGAMLWYRDASDEKNRNMVAKELEELESSLPAQLSIGQTVVKLMDKDNKRPFLILVALFVLYPLTGMYSITFFAIDLFEKLGLGSAQAVAVTSALVRVLGTSVSSVLIGRFGRRNLYIPSAALTCITAGLIGAVVIVKEAGGLGEMAASWILVTLIFLFMFAIGVSIANFPWVLMAEWFSPDLKTVVAGTLITVQFGFIFLAVQMTSSIMSILGTGGLFLYFSAICALNTLFVVLMVPETHGQTFSAMRPCGLPALGPAVLLPAGLQPLK